VESVEDVSRFIWVSKCMEDQGRVYLVNRGQPNGKVHTHDKGSVEVSRRKAKHFIQLT